MKLVYKYYCLLLFFHLQLIACSKNLEKFQNSPSSTLIFAKEYKSLRRPSFSLHDVLLEYSHPIEFISKTSALENIVILSSKHILIVNPDFSGSFDLRKLKVPKVSENKIKAIWIKRASPTDASLMAVSESLDRISSGSEYRRLHDLAIKKKWGDNNGFFVLLQVNFAEPYSRGRPGPEVKKIFVIRTDLLNPAKDSELLAVRTQKEIAEIFAKVSPLTKCNTENISFVDLTPKCKLRPKHIFVPAKITVSKTNPGATVELGANIPGSLLDFEMVQFELIYHFK